MRFSHLPAVAALAGLLLLAFNTTSRAEGAERIASEGTPAIWRGLYWSAGLGVADSGIDISGAGKKDVFDVENGSVSLFGALGYNMTNGPFVFGIEADIGGPGMDKKKDLAGLGTVHVDGVLAGSVRARAGYAFDNVLLYGTAGVAFSKMKISSSLGGKDDSTNVGLVAGLGAEVALDADWRLRGEGLIYGFGDEGITLAATKHDIDTAHATFRVGLGRKF